MGGGGWAIFKLTGTDHDAVTFVPPSCLEVLVRPRRYYLASATNPIEEPIFQRPSPTL